MSPELSEHRHCPDPGTDPLFDSTVAALIEGQQHDRSMDATGLTYKYAFMQAKVDTKSFQVCDWRTDQQNRIIGQTVCRPIIEWVAMLASTDPDSEINKKYSPSQLADGVHIKLLITHVKHRV